VPHQIIWCWYTGRWWVGCYIWYSEEGTERGCSPPRPLLAVENVTAHPPITIFLSNGLLLCGFNVTITALNVSWHVFGGGVHTYVMAGISWLLNHLHDCSVLVWSCVGIDEHCIWYVSSDTCRHWTRGRSDIYSTSVFSTGRRSRTGLVHQCIASLLDSNMM